MIPFVDLKLQIASIRSEIDQAISKVLDSCQFVLGQEVESFEHEFADYCHCKFGAGVNSGTSALHLALLAAGVGPGDEVITVSHTFVATVAAITYTGATPIFVDIRSDSLNIDPDLIEKAISARTKAIIPVHLYGQPTDMDSIMSVAVKYGLFVIEDAAQAHGAEYKGRRVGSIGHMGCFSFYPGKNLGACGEGGMVVSNDLQFTEHIKILRDWGAKKKYSHDCKGYNYRLEGLQGAVLRVKLRYIDQWTEARREHGALYDELLINSGISKPLVRPDVRHVYHVYAIQVDNRNSVQRSLLDGGVHTGIHYPIPVHLQKGYVDLNYGLGDLPNSEQAAKEVLSLPMYAELENVQIEKVVELLRRIYENSGSEK